MDTRYEAYCFADPLFYDSPGTAAAQSPDFYAGLGQLPAGWERSHRDSWVMLAPAGTELPAQGWKVHVSGCLAEAEAVVAQVRAYCLEHGLAVKFLRNRGAVAAANSKYAPRGSSGKLATIYPADEAALHRVLLGLGPLLAGRPGPYILSDLRWADGPLYVRYGGFAERYVPAAGGGLEPAIQAPTGELVPDRRGPAFQPPQWVSLPEFLGPALAARAAQTVADLPFTVRRALHFSNGGGVYAGVETATGRPVVIKEARPYSGLDQHGDDAVSRLLREREMLSELAGIPGVPAVLGYAVAGGHHFLVQEQMPGEPLSRLLAIKHPLIRAEPAPQDVAAYRDWALAVGESLALLVAAVHERGIVFGDLHPGNVLVAGDVVSLVDFELAGFAAEQRRPGLGAAGYAAPKDRTGFAIDAYALACLRLAMFLPLTAYLPLDPGVAGRLAAAAVDRLGMPAELAASIVDCLTGTDADGVAGVRLDSVARGILASATPERADRLYPGDIGQFTHNGYGIAYGAAGVLYALAAVGEPVPEDAVDWLVRRVAERPVRQVGLYDGLYGIAYVLQVLGRGDEAGAVLERAGSAPEQAFGRELFGGAAGAGVALLLLAAARDDGALAKDALALAERLAGDGALAGGVVPNQRPGLLHGRSGEALLFLRAHDWFGDPALLDAAAEALRADLDRCVEAADGSLQVDDTWRQVPYLGTGSAGIGLVLHEFLAYRPDERFAAALAGIQRAALPELTAQSGLFNGRAGLLALLHLTGGPREAIDRHLRNLRWHAVAHRGELAFPGDQLVRLSMDLATGSAGVLLAARTARDPGAALLPLLPGLRNPGDRTATPGRR
jgi:tRNA A-37 threonylcarbamoyl transferase component Bud32